MSYPQLLTPEEKLADAKQRLNLPRIVAICGSTRFMAEMTEANLQETVDGNIVVAPGFNMKEPHLLWAGPVEAEALKTRLDDLHRAKIRLADEVLVVGDYIGDSTRAEIAYARELGKPVRFTHPEVDVSACDSRRAHTTRSSSMEPNIQAGQVWESIYGGAHVAITQIDGTRIRLATVTIKGDTVRPYGSERWATRDQLVKAYRLTDLTTA